MSFIVFEGIDGSGKSTQVKNLTGYLNARGEKVQQMHFPRTEAPYFGELIGRFLRGEFGGLDKVHPYLVAMLYAGDRWDAGKTIRQWLAQGYWVILDRYYYSNIAFQCAKTRTAEEALALSNWIRDLELNYFGIPVPDINLFLDVPQYFTTQKLQSGREGTDRAYLQGSRDIHEESLEFQARVRQQYLNEAQRQKDLIRIDCSDGNNHILEPCAVFDKIIAVLTQQKLV